MITITVHIDNKKAKKAVKTILDALGLSYKIELNRDRAKRPFNKAEQVFYNDLNQALKQIKQHQEGQIDLRGAR